VTQPDERRHIIRSGFQRSLEEQRRLLRFSLKPVELSQVVGPTNLSRCQRQSVEKTRFGLGIRLSGEEKLAHLAVRSSALVGWCGPVILDLRQRGELVAQLLLNRRSHPR